MQSISKQYWKEPATSHLSQTETDLSRTLGVSQETIKLLSKRGLVDKNEISQFLFPKLSDLPDPFLIRGAREACLLIYKALEEGREILIWGDYDVDGVTGTSLLVRFFESLGHSPKWFIPNRFSDGYGLNSHKISEIFIKNKSNTPLLITVDCGISNIEEVLLARKIGCEVIITDHHLPGDVYPDANAILNCKQDGCDFPDKNLSGVALAFYLAVALRAFLADNGYFKGGIQQPNMKQLLELVAVGTIADMVSLTNCNRILVKGGFEVMNTSPSCGMAALLKECHIYNGDITSEDIAFQLAPKINAAGRLKDASLAVKLLIEKDTNKAKGYAKQLTNLNNERKSNCAKYLESTLHIVGQSEIEGAGIIVERVDCPVGVIGIVASQLANKFKVPVILVTEIEDKMLGRVLKGSCRSIPGINIYELLGRCRKYIHLFGGHPMAAGVTILTDNFVSFSRKIKMIVSDFDKKHTQPEEIDLDIPIERATSKEMTKELSLIEPFGVDNHKPRFRDKQIVIQDVKKIGKNGEHVSFVKRGRYENSKCIAFQFGDYEYDLRSRPHFDAVYSVSISRFKRATRWQAQIIDLL